MTEERETTEPRTEQFKYIQVTPRDKSWGLAVTTAGYQHVHPGDEYPLSIHPSGYNFSNSKRRVLNEYQIVYITRGEGFFESASCSRTRIVAGDLFMLFPGEWHTYGPDPETGWDEHWIGFNGGFMDDKISSGFFTFKNCVFRMGIDERITDIYHEILDLIRGEQKGFQQMAGGLTMSLISRVYYEDINHSLSDSYKTKIIKQAKLLMQEDMSHNRSLEEIAEYLGMSYSTFRRDFKAACGMSPGQYRLELKIIKAKELLYSTRMSIADISSDLFFENSGQFSNFFKKKVGVSPFEYRKRMANKDNNS